MLSLPTDDAEIVLWERACALRIACEVRIILDRFSLAWAATGPVPKAVPIDWIDERMDRALCELVRDLERRGGFYLTKHFANHTQYDRLAFSEHAMDIIDDARAHYGHDVEALRAIEHAVYKAMGWAV